MKLYSFLLYINILSSPPLPEDWYLLLLHTGPQLEVGGEKINPFCEPARLGRQVFFRIIV